ncbi:hypothetical protein SK128_018720, partial [Halocaridina rubra]
MNIDVIFQSQLSLHWHLYAHIRVLHYNLYGAKCREYLIVTYVYSGEITDNRSSSDS